MPIIQQAVTPLGPTERFGFGPKLGSAQVLFRLWAPKQELVGLEIDGKPLAMSSIEGGWHEASTHLAGPGSLYQFVLSDGFKVPDPGSRFQPQDVHGPSEVIDPAAFAWTDHEWLGRPWEEAVVYELHVGAFTAEGTFAAAMQRLDHLAELGVTAIQLMPVSDFPGSRNWGYDGVLLYAPDSSYGRPEDLKALVNACHARGLMVFLDVVYNHFGPEGNYLPSYAPALTDAHQTPWGAAVNYDDDGSAMMRCLVIENALYWLGEFHIDGLRFDAVHAIKDSGPQHLLEEIARHVWQTWPDRHVHLILENEENEACWLERRDRGAIRFTAQWNDDVHHVLHTAASGEGSGYYAEYLNDTEKLGRALAEGFAFQGEPMAFRGHARGSPSAHLPPTAFVSFIQNHDQVGNRAFGDRITSCAPAEAVRAIASVYLLAPQIPMIFMGEEWAADQPFPFFCDFGPQLAEAVREGRRNEFARFPEFADPASRARIPDPTDAETFRAAKLDWTALHRAEHGEWLELYRKLLAIRREEISHRLASIRSGGSYEALAAQAVQVTWQAGAERLVLEANLSAVAVERLAALNGRTLWQIGDVAPGQLGPWAVHWALCPGEP